MRRCRKRATPWPFNGIRKLGERWQARITVDRKSLHIGTFETAEDAARAYDAAAIRHFGYLAVCNFGGGNG